MIISYHGHSCFKLKGRRGTVVTDPYEAYVGFNLPNLSADIVTVSHQHKDHNAVAKVKGTEANPKPFLIDCPGEYEVGGISVFGERVYHDASQGSERGENTVFTILLDDVRVCHLGDLGHALTETLIEKIGVVDVLFVPVGGSFTINPEQAVAVIRAIDPSIVIPMHYKTPEHDQKVFGDLKTLADFTKEFGLEPTPVPKLTVEKDRLPEEMELVILNQV
ncbi:MAG TPA: Zn-dependent hydrolase [Candidatus Pacebacteria bacterium]|nr:Zn-dependent hydrolase [Candidatus Paceibacterota bacterium]